MRASAFKKIMGMTATAAISALIFTGCSDNNDDEDGDGWYWSNPKANTFNISTAEELAELAVLVNDGTADFKGKTVTLTADINLSSFNSGKGWTPIGWNVTNADTSSNGQSFCGIFNGNNKTVNGLYINDPDNESIGLFGLVTDGGEVKNLNVVNVNITGLNRVGGVVGNIGGNSKVINCSVSGTVKGTGICAVWGNSEVGGVAGSVWGTGTRITNCRSSATVSGISSVGGVAGTVAAGAVITDCSSSGTVSGDSEFVGGVVGGLWDAGSSVTSCYSTGVVSGGQNFGGVVGAMSEGAAVSMCAALNESIIWIRPDGELRPRSRIFVTDANWDGIIEDNVAFVTEEEDLEFFIPEDGLGITAAELHADGTIGGRFTSANGWTTENGKLPGFGSAVNMPEHLR